MQRLAGQVLSVLCRKVFSDIELAEIKGMLSPSADDNGKLGSVDRISTPPAEADTSATVIVVDQDSVIEPPFLDESIMLLKDRKV